MHQAEHSASLAVVRVWVYVGSGGEQPPRYTALAECSLTRREVPLYATLQHSTMDRAVLYDGPCHTVPRTVPYCSMYRANIL